MGIGGLFRGSPAAAPENRAAFSTLQGLLSAYPGGAPWEVAGSTELDLYRGAMSIPGAWRALQIIGDIVGKLPWDAYTRHGKSTPELLDPRPTLLDQPSPPDTRMTTFSGWAMDLVWHGNAIGVIAARDRNGTPTAVTPIPAPWCGIRRTFLGAPTAMPLGPIEYQIGGQTFAPHDVIHVKGMTSPGALRGFGVLEAHRRGLLELALEQLRQAQSISGHGVPTGVIKSSKPDATADDLRDLKAAWNIAQRERSVAVLNTSVDFQPLSWNPDELELNESRQTTLLELALLFGLPPSFLGASTGDSMTYTTTSQAAQDLIRFGAVGGWIERIAQTLSLVYPRGTEVKADTDALTELDMLTRYQAYDLAIAGGWMLKSEVRKDEKLKPIAGIDDDPLPILGAQPPADGDQPQGALAPGGKPKPSPIQAAAQRLPSPSPLPRAPLAEQRAHSELENTPHGENLWKYWTHGPGLARWAESPTPYRTLRVELAKEGVPAHMINGLAANIFGRVFHETPSQHAKNGV